MKEANESAENGRFLQVSSSIQKALKPIGNMLVYWLKKLEKVVA